MLGQYHAACGGGRSERPQVPSGWPDQCAGRHLRTKEGAVAVCTQGNAQAQQAGAIACTRENFQLAVAPGVMMLDHDGLPDGEFIGAAVS